jgi:hypothetical protein
MPFEDDSTWAFDIPKIHLSGARRIVSELASRV